MPEDISNALERTAAGEHPTRQRVAQQVEPAAPFPLIEPDALEGLPHDRGQFVRGDERLERCLVPDEHVPRCRRRPAVPEVGEQGVSDLGEQRQGEDAAGLGLG